MWKWRLLLKLIKAMSLYDRTRYGRHLLKLQRTILGEYQHALPQWQVKDTYPHEPPPPEVPLMETTAKIGVVLQGPLRRADNFTVRTVELYQQTFPGSPIIISTWRGEDAATLARLAQLGAQIVLSDPPPVPGHYNVNKQIVSSVAGLRLAAELGCQYALKTRGDARFYAHNLADFFTGLLAAFPIAQNLGQRGRLVVLERETLLLNPHHASDFLTFGYTEDVLKYWDAPQAPMKSPKVAIKRHTFGDNCAEIVPEIYVCRSFLRRCGEEPVVEIDAWWRTLAERFVVIDRSAVDYFWPKYSFQFCERRIINRQQRLDVNCSFREWLSLYVHHKTPLVAAGDLWHSDLSRRLVRALDQRPSQQRAA